MKTGKSLYSELEMSRHTYLQRARDCSELTIPTLVPPAGHSFATEYSTPFQGIGARGVNNLASKLLLALLPPNQPFFKFSIDEFRFKKLQGDKTLKAEMEKALSVMERAVMTEIENSAVRVATFEALRHLLVAGNCLLYLPASGGMRVFRLENYVVKRDAFGNVLDIVTRERLSVTALPDEAKKLVPPSESNEPNIDLFTCVHRKDDKWYVYQTIKDSIIPGSKGEYELDKLPWIPLRFIRVDGEDYGRGFVEEYLGDLRSLEALTQAVVEASASAAKVVFLVRPNGVTNKKMLAEARNGAIITGDRSDVSCLQVEKQADLRIAQSVMEAITMRLGYAFLLNASVVRNAERVTAEEIRYLSNEIETALGGAYSVLSQEFQLPLVSRLMDRMQRQNRLPKLDNKIIRPVVTTGVDALGRASDLTKLDLFVQGIAAVLGPQGLSQFINLDNYLTRRATSLGIDIEGLIKDQTEVAQQMQQANQQQMMAKLTESLGPQAIATAGKLAENSPGFQAGLAQALGQTPPSQ
ncbi:MAG: phage tail protein [Flavobacteriia bacterium]|nr:phage tail protein [Flavobacteriia bacterium]